MRKKFKRYLFLLSWLKSKIHKFSEIETKLALYNDEESYSQRQFQRDIKELEDIFGGAIKSVRNEGYKYFHDEDNSIQLFESLDYINSIFLHPGGGDMILMEKRKASGSEHIATILKAIDSKHTISISYKPFNADEAFDLELKPLILKQAIGRIYLLALPTHKEIEQPFRTYGLDRIQAISITTNKYKHAQKLDFEAYFEHIYGVSDYVEPEEIQIEVKEQQGHYIQTYPLHRSQKLVEATEEKMIFSFYTTPNTEFTKELLSYGMSLKVLKPLHLKNSIKKELKEALANY